jgi:hypothetical protein
MYLWWWLYVRLKWYLLNVKEHVLFILQYRVRQLFYVSR